MNDKETRNDYLKVRLTRTERNLLQAEANRLGITLSSLIRAHFVNGVLIKNK
jgi:hypothetical protein